jgi:hypothetical protein
VWLLSFFVSLTTHFSSARWDEAAGRRYARRRTPSAWRRRSRGSQSVRWTQESTRSCGHPSDPLKFIKTHDVPYLARQLSGFSTTSSKFVSIVSRERMVSTGDIGIRLVRASEE